MPSLDHRRVVSIAVPTSRPGHPAAVVKPHVFQEASGLVVLIV